MNLFDIAAALTLNSSDYEKGLDNAGKKAGGFASTAKKAFAGVGTAVAAVGTAATAVGVAFSKGVGETAEYGDSIDKMSQKLGLSAEAYQEWDFILQHSGSSIDALMPTIKSLEKNITSNADAFEALGISQEQAAKMSSEELFAATVTALQNVEDESERARLASKTLGKGAKELGALLNTSAADTAAMKKQVHDLGGVMSDDAVKGAAAYQDSLQNLHTATDGMKRNLMSEFMPAMGGIMDGLTAIFSGDSESGIGMISNGITDLATQLLEKIPELVPVVMAIITALGTAIIENAPMIIDSAMLLLGQLTSTVLENLPMILEMVLTIIENIATAIGTDLPTLIPAIVSAVMGVAQMIVDNLPQLLSALMQIMEGLAKGIIAALPTIIEALPTIIKGIVNFFIGSIPQIIQTGISLLTALIGALPDIIKAIVDALPQIITGIIDAILDNIPLIIQAGVDLLTALITNLPQIIATIVTSMPQIIANIVSALAKGIGQMANVGLDLVKGLWNGISNAANWVLDKIKDFGGKILGGIKKFFGIHSPSAVFRDAIGKNLVAGLGEGIDKYADIALDSMDKLADDILDAATIEPTVKIGSAGEYGYAASRGVQVTQNIYAQRMTPSEIFEEAREQQERLVLMGV